MLTQSCRGIQYTGFLLQKIYVNTSEEHSLVGSVFYTQRNLCSNGLILFLLAMRNTVDGVFVTPVVIMNPQNNPFKRHGFVSSLHSDELCNSMRLGHLYRVLGFPAHVHQWQSISWSVEANNVQLWEPARKAAALLHTNKNNVYV